MKTLYLAGGCFWGCQKFFDRLPGVRETQVGYANGPISHPTYEQVKAHAGHAETVKVVYDPAALPLPQLLEKYFSIIDPTARNRQGGDVGIQYRTGVYFVDEKDEPVIRAALAQLQQQYARPVVVECLPLQNFWPAEEYHQKYLEKHPQGYCHLHFDD